MSVELIGLMVAVVLTLVTLLTKYLTTIRLVRLHEKLHRAEVELHQLKGTLKGVENEKAVAESNEKNLNSQKERMEKRLPTLRKEVERLSS